MTTVKTERKDAAIEPKKEERSQAELQTVSAIHTLSQMLYGEITKTSPWAAPTSALTNFQCPTVYSPSMESSVAPVMAGAQSPLHSPITPVREARKMYMTDPTLYGATLPQREFPVMDPFFGTLPMQGVPWRNFPQANLPLQGFPWQNFQLGNLPPQGFPIQGFPQQGFPQQGFPVQGFPVQGFPPQGLPMQGFQPQVPWQHMQKFVPPIYPYGHLPYTQSVGYPPFMAAPFVPTAINPYLPLQEWQRSF